MRSILACALIVTAMSSAYARGPAIIHNEEGQATHMVIQGRPLPLSTRFVDLTTGDSFDPASPKDQAAYEKRLAERQAKAKEAQEKEAKKSAKAKR